MYTPIIFFVFYYFTPILGTETLAKRIPARDLGVKCDGRSDDTEALNAAIRGLAEGEILELPGDSICPTTGNLEITNKKNIGISGSSGARILARRASNSAIKIKDSESVRIDNFEIIVPYSRANIWNPNAAGIFIELSGNIQVFRVKISKAADLGIFVKKSQDIYIQENEISETFQNGIHVEYSVNVYIIRNRILDIKRHGIAIRPIWSEENASEKPSKNIKIWDNLINGTDLTGITIDTAEDVDVERNRIYGTFATGIRLSDWWDQSGDLINVNLTYNIIANSPRENHENNKWEAPIRVIPNKSFMEHIYIERNFIRDPKARVPPPHKTFAMVFWTENSGFIDDLRVLDNKILDETEEIECISGMSYAAIGFTLVQGNTKNEVDCPAPNKPNEN